MKWKVVHIVLALCCSTTLWAQEEKQYMREGNSLYKNQQYEASVERYNQSLEKKPDNFEAGFNLGDAMYRQQKFADAASQFEVLSKKAATKEQRAKAYHNLGNSLLQAEQYEKSIDAYKNALRNNPRDEETRYNLAYAQKKLKQQQQQQEQDKENEDNEENNDENKDDQENKDNQNNDENKDDKENKDQEGDNKENKDNQDNKDNKDENKDQNKDQNKDGQDDQKQQRPNQLSREDAKRMLDALNNEEKAVQKAVNKLKGKGEKTNVEKDW